MKTNRHLSEEVDKTLSSMDDLETIEIGYDFSRIMASVQQTEHDLPGIFEYRLLTSKLIPATLLLVVLLNVFSFMGTFDTIKGTFRFASSSQSESLSVHYQGYWELR